MHVYMLSQMAVVSLSFCTRASGVGRTEVLPSSGTGSLLATPFYSLHTSSMPLSCLLQYITHKTAGHQHISVDLSIAVLDMAA